jgi:Cd2+/Zn2+-exporting ATPase
MTPMSQVTRLDLPLLLPDAPDTRDACIIRLVTVLEGQPGVAQAHVLDVGDLEPGGAAPVTRPVLCLHYDPDQITLSEVEGMARGAGASISAQYAHRLLPIRLVATEDVGTRLESELRAVPGVTAASVNLAAQVARVEYDRTVATDEQIDAAVRAASAAPKQAEDAVAASQGWYARNRELAWSLMSGALLLAGWLLERNAFEPRWIPITTYVLSYVFGARDNVGHFLGDLRRGKFHFNIDLLMVVAAAGAAVLGEWAEGALLLVLFSLGHALEHYALGRARSAITALAELAPSRATVLRAENGVQREVVVGIDLVRPGDVVIVKPAERVPVDGTVRKGRSGVNQAPITGESVPVDKAPGDPMFAGSVNGEGALLIDVTVAIGDRTLDRVIKLVSEAQTQKAPTQQFTERFARVFVPLVLIGDVLLIVVPPLLGLLSWSESFARAMAVLVAASPCALALGTPAAVLAGIAQAARNGVLIKGGAHLEALGSIRSLAFDKTGTITVGEPSVTDIVPMTGVADVVVLINAASVEQRSQHPLAKAVVRRAVEQQLAVPEAGELQSITARGVRAPVDGAVVEIGRALLFEDAGVVVPQDVRDAVTRLENAGRSTMIVRRVGHTPEFLGVLGLADEPRANARATLVALRGAGIQRIIMLTGDNAGVGNEVGTAVGVDEVRAGLLPEDKVSSIKELAARGPVAMVGDGVNDAPALAHATVGIAMGGAGTAAALETADVALMGDDLSRLPFAIALSRQAKRVIRQNLFVSLGVIVALVAVTVSGMASIGPAVIAHEGSTLVVIANALRLLRFRAKG